MQGWTHAGTSSTGGVARELATRAKSERGPNDTKPTGSLPMYATRPAEFRRRRASFARIARRRASTSLVADSAMPSSRCWEPVSLGWRSQHCEPQVPRVTVFTSSTRAAVSARTVIFRSRARFSIRFLVRRRTWRSTFPSCAFDEMSTCERHLAPVSGDTVTQAHNLIYGGDIREAPFPARSDGDVVSDRSCGPAAWRIAPRGRRDGSHVLGTRSGRSTALRYGARRRGRALGCDLRERSVGLLHRPVAHVALARRVQLVRPRKARRLARRPTTVLDSGRPGRRRHRPDRVRRCQR